MVLDDVPGEDRLPMGWLVGLAACAVIAAIAVVSVALAGQAGARQDDPLSLPHDSPRSMLLIPIPRA